ncbi:MAG: T9SS type A sorting domain-containing protein [Chloroflexota bacterium]
MITCDTYCARVIFRAPVLFLFTLLFLSAGANAYSAAIEIIEQPKELLECEGAKNLKLRVLVKVPEGTAVQYQWYRDGNPIPGATKSYYKIPKMNSNYNGIYRCRIWTSSENLYSREVAVYTLAKTAILSQDTLVKVPFGKTAVLKVETHTKGYSAPFFQQGYQWWRRVEGRRDVKLEDGERYSGTKSPQLHISRVEGDLCCSNFEGYYLEVRGQCGKVYSKLIRVMPNLGVKFTDEFSTGFIYPFVYEGCPKYLYDKKRKGKYWNYQITCKIMGDYDSVQIEHVCVSEGATDYWTPYKRVFSKAFLKKRNDTISYYDSSLVFSNRPTSKHSQRNYTRVTFFPGGEVQESEGYTWIFYDGPVITKQPKSQTVYELENFTLSVEAKSIYRLTYQWFHNGDTLYREKKNKLTIKKGCYIDEGAYWVEIGHVCDTMRSDTAIIRIKPWPTIKITKQPKSIKACEGAADLTLSVSAENEMSDIVRYLWYKDGTRLIGEENSILKIPVLTPDVLGKYKCHVWDPYTFLEGVYSEEVEVAMYPKMEITRQDSMMIFKYGGSGTLSVETQLTGPTDSTYQVEYQWFRKQTGYEDIKVIDGERYSGTNTTKLTIKTVDSNEYLVDGDGYYLEIQDECGKRYSDLIHVSPCDTVRPDTSIITIKPKGKAGTRDISQSYGILSASPNPASEYLDIKFNSPERESTFKILEASGREVMSFTAEACEGRVRRDISALASGAYWLVMESGGERYIEKFIIIQ